MATWRDVQAAVATLGEAPERLREMRESYAAKRAEFAQNPDWSERFRDEQLGKLTERMQSEFTSLQSLVREARATVAAWRPAAAASIEEQLLAEQREARAWARAERLLASGVSPLELIVQAKSGGDVETLKALRAELPTHVAGQAAGRTLEERQSAALHLARAVDVALAQTLPDGVERQALRARLQEEALAPVAEAELAYTASQLSEGGTDHLHHVIQVRYLRNEAAPVLEALEGPGAA